MRLDEAEAMERLVQHDHGVLCTLHPVRGVDAVPVVFAVVEGHLGIPVDTVKPKSSTRLQRERNLATDPRATLLVEHWDRDDWSMLWWVRAELHRVDDGRHVDQTGRGVLAGDVEWTHHGSDADAPPSRSAAADERLEEALAGRLADRYPQYRDRPFASILTLRIERVTGWTASA